MAGLRRVVSRANGEKATLWTSLLPLLRQFARFLLHLLLREIVFGGRAQFWCHISRRHSLRWWIGIFALGRWGRLSLALVLAQPIADRQRHAMEHVGGGRRSPATRRLWSRVQVLRPNRAQVFPRLKLVAERLGKLGKRAQVRDGNRRCPNLDALFLSHRFALF